MAPKKNYPPSSVALLDVISGMVEPTALIWVPGKFLGGSDPGSIYEHFAVNPVRHADVNEGSRPFNCRWLPRKNIPVLGSSIRCDSLDGRANSCDLGPGGFRGVSDPGSIYDHFSVNPVRHADDNEENRPL